LFREQRESNHISSAEATPQGRYKKKGLTSVSIDFLERWLIAAAIEKNPGLINTKETPFLRKISVVGVFNAKSARAE
jgi:hypothetical protein